MRRTYILVALLLLVPAAQAVDVRLDEDTSAAVDLVSDGGDVIDFAIADAVFSNDPVTVTLQLNCTCDVGEATEEIVIDLSMKKSGGDWEASLSVDHVDLVAGAWYARATGLAGAGQERHPSAPGFPITVTPGSGSLEDTSAPVIRVLNLDMGAGEVLVAEGQSVQVSVTDQLLRRVTHDIGGQGEILWASPYNLASTNFQPDGQHVVTVTAQDRAGHEAQISFLVYVDTSRPDVSVNVPDALYQGVPNAITVFAEDASNHTVRARFDDSIDTVDAGAGSGTHTLHVVPEALGEGAVEIVVTDRVGNRVRLLEDVTVVPLQTDVILEDAAQVDGGAIGGETLTLNVTASQAAGLVDVPVNITFAGQVIGTLLVTAEGDSSVEFDVDFPVGHHEGNLTLVVPDDVNETAPANQEIPFVIERFLARVIDGERTYHIRADARGLPLEAVDAEGRTYEIQLQDRGLTSVYVFTVDGKELWWNPESTVTTIPQETEGEDSPGLPIAILLAALVALGRRKK